MSDETQTTESRNGPRWVGWLSIVVVLAVLVGIGVSLVRMIPITHRYYTDADTIKTPAGEAKTRDILWQPPKRLAEVVNTRADDYEPRFSADGLTLYFVRGKAGENADIYVTKRTYEGWTQPEPLAALNTDYEDLGPEPSADGQSLYFYSDRPGGLGGYDLWVAHRSWEGWQNPINLGPLVNSEFNDYGPAVTPDGKTLYFSSNRPLPQDVNQPDPNAWPATIREDLFHRTYDLYMAPMTDGGFGSAEVLTSLNSTYNEGAPAVSSFGDFLYFASDRPGGEGGFDLYRSRRMRNEHRPVENLGPTVNTHANELDPGLGLGGFALIFSSDATTGDSRPDAPREYNLCYTTSREVFTDIDRVPRQPLNWAALWETILPNLLWALLALLALLLMLALLRDVRGRRLSLLAKCLLASLMAHLLLLLLFNVWEVTATLAREFRRGGRIQIALASPAAGDSLVRQVRGQLTDVDALIPMEMPRERQTAPVEVEASTTMASLSVQRGTIEMPEELEADVTTDDATIEQRIESPPLPELQTETRSAMMLDMTLPAEQARIRAAESDSSAQTLPVNTPPPARPSVAVAMSRPVEATADIARIPPSFDTNEAPPEASSLVTTSPGREAGPRTSATIDTASTLASLDIPRMTDLPLPQAPVDRMPELTESAPRITVPATAAPRYDLPDNVLSQAPTGPEVSIEPEVTGTTLDDSTFADMPTAHAIEVEARDEFIDPNAAAAPEPAVPKLAEVDLSDFEADSAARLTESAPEPVLHSTAPLRRDLPSEAMLQVDRESQVSIDPQSIASPADPSSLAIQPYENAPEAVPSNAWADAQATPRADPTLPSSSDLALTELETLPGSAAAEPQVELRPRNVDRLRPSVTVNVKPEVNRPTQVSFNPRPANAVPAATSLATESSRHVRETTPGYESGDTSSALQAVAVIPELEDLRLPDMEQSSTTYRGEVSPDVNWVASTAPRASLSGSLTSTENTTTTPTFDIPLTARETVEDSSTSLAELSTGDHDIEHLALTAATPLSTRDLLIPETPDLSLGLPAEVIPPSNPYAQRSAPDRLTMVERMGGSEETELAVAAALAWLARHQSKDGHWDGKHFDEECGGCGGETEVNVDHALTGLALLCFYGAGHTHADDGPYRENIERGLRWLVARQSSDGDLRGDETMYTQGIATIALSEAFGMTQDSSLAEPIHIAARFIDHARNTRVGGWRYDPGQVGDTSVLGWQVMALRSASLNGIATPAASFKAARDWLDLVSHPSRPGRYAYQPGRGYTPAMTAEGMFAQQLLGLSREDSRMQASAEYLADHLPDWEGEANTYYWYYGTLAMFQHQGEPWRMWNETLTEQLLEHQRNGGPAAGSWDPKGEWADIGGRIYQTTLCTLMLEVYYRYLPLYTLDGTVDPIGAIRGFVSDVSTGSALPGATVRLVLPDREPISVMTGNDGGYTLMAPEVPDFFALSASLDGYLPSTANVDSAMVQGTTLAVDFQLAPENLSTVAMERVPDVHHLGDDNFDGTINSQFQKKSEGSTFTAEFELSEAQLSPYFNEAEVTLMAKGVQRRHTIRINGVVLDDRLDHAPSDGSFGEFTASFDIAILEAGTNTFEIIARPSTSDIDDFEFVNIQINLSP